ncbi:hypothetical protein C8R45DRAFT_1208989 [Mycena sanguinolenta]|nr:hypothetical protein C8R45DRAFT_1208989 [Mycena sanguinolenta]
MSDSLTQGMANFLHDLMESAYEFTEQLKPSPSPPPSRSTTPATSNREESSPGATAGESFFLLSAAESAPKRVDNGDDVLEGGDTAKPDKSDTVQSMRGGPSYNVHVYGGTGGSGGQGGDHGGHGGPGEGPKFDIRDSNVTLTDPHATTLQFIEKKLAGHVAAQHKFTDQSKSLCAADTRVEVQANINQWLSLGSSTKERIFWVTGIAGSGKSTLSATLVDNLRKKGTPVAAQFFISRNIPETTDPAKIIPTMAQQLAEFSPDAAQIIQEKLKNGFPSSRKEQVEALLLSPIWELSKSREVVIILIDALDELQTAAQSVMEILSPIAPKGCKLPDNVRFLITSRPEHWADISRSKTLELKMFKQQMLATDDSVKEVKNFIVAKMKEITPNEPGWENWPHHGDLLGLSNKANGLFHYAATALNWIEGQIQNDGRACQNTVFNELTLLGIGELEDLYKVILTSFGDKAKDLDKVTNEQARAALELRRENRLCGFQHVIGAILVLQEPLTISQIIALLADIPVGNLDVGHFLQQMRSVLVPGTTTLFENATPQMHKTFRDYIMDGHAPAEFCILTGHAHFVTAKSCLEVIVKGGSLSDIVVEYSVQHWYKHLRKAVEGGVTCEDERMWNLFGQIVGKAVVGIWATTNWMDLFVDMAAAGWGLLKRHTSKDKMQEISNILIKAKEVRAFPPSPMFVLLTFSCLLVSSEKCEVRAFPPSPMFVLLTFSCLLVSSIMCVVRAFPPSPMFVLLTFSCLLVSSEKCLVRAFPPSPMFVLLTFSCLLVSSSKCYVRAFPPSPMFVLLTFSCLLVSRNECVLFPHRPCLSCSLFLAFSSLLVRAFPPSPMFVLLTFSCLLVSSDSCLVRAFPPSPMFVLLTFSCLLVSSIECRVRAFPPSPMFVLLTFSCLLVSSDECEVRAFPPSPMFVLLTFSCLLVSSDECEVRAFPPSPMFVLLTFSCLLVSSDECRVRAFPPLPMFVLLTFSRVLVSRKQCVISPLSSTSV